MRQVGVAVSGELGETVFAQPGPHRADGFVDLLAQHGLLLGHMRQQLVHQYGAALLVGQAGVGVRPIAAPAAGRQSPLLSGGRPAARRRGVWRSQAGCGK